MRKLSLRWRITLLMGVLVLFSCVLLTALSIHNMTDNFVLPMTKSSDTMNETASENEIEGRITFSADTGSLPEGVQFVQEIKLDVENARQSFSVFSYFYLGLVVAGAMLAAYCLAGRAMRPIAALNGEINTMDGKSLSKRVTLPHTKDEIENLSRSFNGLFERLEREFGKEKRFSANAAHELKTPLATIMTSAQVLKLNDQTTVEEYRENLEITLQSVRRISDVLDGLLLLGSSDTEVTPEPVNIAQLLYGIQEELKPAYCEKHISLTYDLKAGMLTGNPLLLYRAFFNLTENAYKYTEQGGSITIASYYREDQPVIRISDTGIGIPEEDLEHIFEPFYRADKSRSRKIAGAGLGLSIAKEIFDLHKAKVSVFNREEGGTAVEVEFQA